MQQIGPGTFGTHRPGTREPKGREPKRQKQIRSKFKFMSEKEAIETIEAYVASHGNKLKARGASEETANSYKLGLMTGILKNALPHLTDTNRFWITSGMQSETVANNAFKSEASV